MEADPTEEKIEVILQRIDSITEDESIDSSSETETDSTTETEKEPEEDEKKEEKEEIEELEEDGKKIKSWVINLRKENTLKTLKIFGNSSGKQNKRDFIRLHLTSRLLWPIGWGLSILILQLGMGLYSASDEIEKSSLFGNSTHNLIFFVTMLVFFDLGGELLFVFGHDIPLCNFEFFKIDNFGEKDDAKSKKKIIEPKYLWLTRLGLLFQIISFGVWISLIVFMARDLFSAMVCDEEIYACSSFSSALSAVLVLAIAFAKNLIRLVAYFTRFGIFPIVFSEDVLFLHHIFHERLEEIIDSFKQFFDPDNLCITPKFQMIMYFVIALALDLSAITAVTKLIQVDNDVLITFLRALPFVGLVIAQTVSYIIILKVHDIPLILLKKEELEDKKNQFYFAIARTVRFLCLFSWLIIWLYMVFLISNLNCNQDCYCVDKLMPCSDMTDCNGTDYYNDCSSGLCSYYYAGSCSDIQNETNTDQFICTTKSQFSCISSNVQVIDVVLLSLVNLQLTLWTFGTIFKAYIYPITVPSFILFLSYWRAKDKKDIIKAVIKYMIGHQDLSLGANLKV